MGTGLGFDYYKKNEQEDIRVIIYQLDDIFIYISRIGNNEIKIKQLTRKDLIKELSENEFKNGALNDEFSSIIYSLNEPEQKSPNKNELSIINTFKQNKIESFGTVQKCNCANKINNTENINKYYLVLIILLLLIIMYIVRNKNN